MHAAIEEAFTTFDEAPCSNHERRLIAAEQQTARTVEKGHGRIDRRTLTRTTMVNEHLDWPHVGQVFRIERQRTIQGEIREDVAYGITSLGPEDAGAADLLKLARGHWDIENGLHYVRDVSFGEDACRVRKGSAPEVLAALRNVCLALMNQAGWSNKAAAQRRHAAQFQEAVELVCESSEN